MKSSTPGTCQHTFLHWASMPKRTEQIRPYPTPATLGEAWTPEAKPGAYRAGCDFAREVLGVGRGSCLVIGSALFEAQELKDLGWEVTYLDLRDPGKQSFKVVVADARDMQFADKSFDAVSTTCAITHIGTGRYGDRLDFDGGDEETLQQIARVLKLGGVGALSFGPCIKGDISIRLGLIHRAYAVSDVSRLLKPFEVEQIRIWSDVEMMWIAEPVSENPESPDYISVKVHVAEKIDASQT